MIKRVFDLVVALFCMCLFLPVMLLVALAIYLNMGSPVLFCQRRPGKSARLFTLYKFRTMRSTKSSTGDVLADEYRLTALGSFLRRWSLDELPQLVNVMLGDVSLVGPRPLLEEYVALYSPRQARRHEVRPGITGWAQINGRNAISWDEKFDLDVWYVDHQSFALDLKILFITALKLLRPASINQRGHATMEKFRGGSEH